MKLYYSGANSVGDTQVNPIKSLGGNISSTLIPYGNLNDLFNDVSNKTIQESLRETKAFFIKNDKTLKQVNVSMFCEYPENRKLEFKVACVKGQTIELLQSSLDIPYNLTFYDFDVTFANTTLIIGNNLVVGEETIIEGVSIIVKDENIQNYISDVLKAFKTDERYTLSQTGENKILMKHKKFGEFTNTPVIVTQNVGSITAEPFSGGYDGGVSLGDLEPGESFGVYLQRIPTGYNNHKTREEYLEMYEEFRDSGYKEIQNKTKQITNIFITSEDEEDGDWAV